MVEVVEVEGEKSLKVGLKFNVSAARIFNEFEQFCFPTQSLRRKMGFRTWF